MAADLKTKIVITADGKPAVSGIDAVTRAQQRLGTTATTAGQQAQAGLGQVETAAREASQEAGGLADAYGAVAGKLAALAAGVKAALLADETRVLKDRVRAIVGESGDWLSVWNEIYQISQDNRVAVADTVQLYQRMAVSADRLGASTADVLAVTRAVQQLGRLGGSTVEEVRQVSVQFGQMLASPLAQAEELNSILDGMPMLAREIEKGLGLMPGTLKQAVLAGLETSKIFEVLLKQAGDINERAKDAATSIPQALTALGNSLTAGLAATDEAVGGATGRWSRGVAELARRLDGLIARFRQAAVPSEMGVDPRLTGQERLNALLERYNTLLAEGDAAQQQFQTAATRATFLPGYARQAALAAAEIKRVQAALDLVGDAIAKLRGQINATGAAAVDANAKATQAALATANAAYAGAAGFAKLKTDIAGTTEALKAMDQAIDGPGPEAAYGDRLREIITFRDQAEAALKTGDLATALANIEKGAKAIGETTKAAGGADPTVRSLAQQFRRMGEAAQQGARDGKDAVDAAAKAMKVELRVKPVLDEAALAAITAKLRAAAVVTPTGLRAAGLAGAENTTTPGGQSARAGIRPGDGTATPDRAAAGAKAMADAAASTAASTARRAGTPPLVGVQDTAEAARAVVEQVFAQPIKLNLDAKGAAAGVVAEVQRALSAAAFTVQVTAVVTQVADAGGADYQATADKVGTMQG